MMRQMVMVVHIAVMLTLRDVTRLSVVTAVYVTSKRHCRHVRQSIV